MSLKQDFKNYMDLCFDQIPFENVKGETEIKSGYIIDEENREPMRKIFETIEGGKFGCLVSGSTGSGKSIIFEALHRVLHPKSPLRFKIEQAQDVVHDYNIYGSEILNQFSVNRNYVIDDIGIETDGKFYGKECNVIADLINVRYNIYKTYGAVTHFTTNLNTKEITAKYGDRIASRLGEMCEIAFLATSDRRKNRTFKGWAHVIHEKGFSEEDKKWYENYRKMQEYRRNMTAEQIEAENIEGRKQFMFGNNPAFQQFKNEYNGNGTTTGTIEGEN